MPDPVYWLQAMGIRHPGTGWRGYLFEFVVFGIKQAWASLFGGLLLALILLTAWKYPEPFFLSRYDLLFFAAIAIQFLLVAFRLEKLSEVRVILVFHVVGTCMELFKTHMGSWTYPEASLIRICGVPLFSGFMYSAVGSYMARVWRSFELRFDHHPPIRAVGLLCLAIYVNFFTHHYIWDFRWLLFAGTAVLFWRTRVYFKVWDHYRWMPLLLGFLLVAFFIWIAENASTFGTIWLYPNQIHGWHLVKPAKLGSWYLLMIISWGLVANLHGVKEKSG